MLLLLPLLPEAVASGRVYHADDGQLPGKFVFLSKLFGRVLVRIDPELVLVVFGHVVAALVPSLRPVGRRRDPLGIVFTKLRNSH